MKCPSKYTHRSYTSFILKLYVFRPNFTDFLDKILTTMADTFTADWPFLSTYSIHVYFTFVKILTLYC